MLRKIVDLHGNIFKILQVIKSWEFLSRVPTLENYQYYFTRDIVTNQEFILAFKDSDNAIGYFYSLQYKLYIAYPLIKVGYDRSKDIRKSYLYVKRKH